MFVFIFLCEQNGVLMDMLIAGSQIEAQRMSVRGDIFLFLGHISFRHIYGIRPSPATIKLYFLKVEVLDN